MGLNFGSITDHEREIMNENDFVQETVFDGGNEMPNTSVYKTWEDYDSGNPMGSYSNSGGYQSQFGNWANALNKAGAFKQSQGKSESGGGYKGGWAQPFAQGSGANVTPMGSGKWMHQYQPAKIAGIVNHPAPPQDSGGGLFSNLLSMGSKVAFATGNPILGAGLGVGSQVV